MRGVLGITVLVTLLASAAGPAGGQSVASMAPLAPGDAIRLAFWREPTMNGEFTVDETGGVVLPLLGVRAVSGVPPEALKARLAQEYGEQLRDRNDVQITLLRRVRVLGAVMKPGLYLVDATMTLGDAVALAGGATRDGRLSGIRVMRDGREVRTTLEEGSPVAEQLRSGDQILVPERSWLARHSYLLIGATISATALIVSNAVLRR